MKNEINVSIIVLDTLRLDTFNKLVSSDPNLIKGLDAVRFERCISPGSWTLPSHASMFTGMSQTAHGCHETKRIKSLDIDRIKLRKRTLASSLKDRGYSTCGISANPYIHPVYGFTGFDTYITESYFTDISGSVVEISDKLKPRVSKYRNIHGNNLLKMSGSIIKEDPNLFLELALSAGIRTPLAAFKKMKAKLIDGWPVEKGGSNILKTVKAMKFREPFFLFVNLMEAHDPYVGSKGRDFNWATPFLKEAPKEDLMSLWRKLYVKASHKALRYGTELAKEVLNRFGDNQIIILTSDHGQLFGEHGFIGHGTMIPDEMVRVPLLVIVPKGFSRNTKTKGWQSLINIPSFLEAALSGDMNAISKLTTGTAIAETFSIPANISSIKGIDRKKTAKFDKYMKRVFE